MSPTARYVSIALALSMVLPPSAMAQEHLVTRTDIAAHLQAAVDERAGNQEKVQRFLASRIPASVDGSDIQRRVVAGVAALSDAELRDLASRADALEADPIAGGPGKKTWIIIGAVVLVIVVLAALAVKSCKEMGAECFNKN